MYSIQTNCILFFFFGGGRKWKWSFSHKHLFFIHCQGNNWPPQWIGCFASTYIFCNSVIREINRCTGCPNRMMLDLKILAKFSHGYDLPALNPAKMEATKKNNFSRRTPHSLLEIASSTMCRLVIEEVNTEQYPPPPTMG